MEQLPKLVRERLQVNPPGEHPDSDLLTAYVEQSLTGKERLQMEDHLAGCSECRQAVALATPETLSEAEAKTLAGIFGRNWLHSPALRWGAVATCVIVVSGAVLLHVGRNPKALAPYGEAQSEQRVELPASPQASSPKDEAKAIPPSSTMVLVEPRPPRDTRKAKTGVPQRAGGGIGGGVFQMRSEQALTEPPSANSPALLSRTPQVDALVADKKAAPMASGPREVTGKSDLQQAGANVAAVPPYTSSTTVKPSNDAAVGASTETVEVTAQAPTLQRETASVAKTARAKNELSQQRADEQATVHFSPKPLPEVAASTKGMADLKAPRWTLSDKGLPQRSFDSGHTWEEVQVDHKDGFRALATVGMEVWVGGKNGLLYHTADMGLHWTRITPTASGASLSGDVVRIEFADSQHGRVIAADGQSWVTSDGGKTWQNN